MEDAVARESHSKVVDKNLQPLFFHHSIYIVLFGGANFEEEDPLVAHSDQCTVRNASRTESIVLTCLLRFILTCFGYTLSCYLLYCGKGCQIGTLPLAQCWI